MTLTKVPRDMALRTVPQFTRGALKMRCDEAAKVRER